NNMISLRRDCMNKTEKIKNEDLRRKNFIIFISFSIAVLGALLVTFIHKEFDHSIIYASGLIIYLLSYVIIKLTKKETLFPIAMIVIAFGTMYTYILLFGGRSEERRVGKECRVRRGED